MRSRNKIVVVGSSNTDMMVKSERLPRPGETLIGGRFMMSNGGKGANQAVAAARLGAEVVFISKTGDDMFRSRSLESYAQDGINTQYVFSDPLFASGVALITVDSGGENCITVAPGANFELSVSDIDRARKVIQEADMVLMQLEIPLDTVQYVADIAREAGVKVVLNPAPACELPCSIYTKTDILIPNRTEAESLSGVSISGWEDAEKAAAVLSGKGVGTVIVTLGSTGALLYHEGRVSRILTHRVDAVDATAAGDTFCGALCVAIAEGQSMEDAVAFANISAGIAVSRMGAQASIPHRKEVDAAMKIRSHGVPAAPMGRSVEGLTKP